jgi:hypothetical protein
MVAAGAMGAISGASAVSLFGPERACALVNAFRFLTAFRAVHLIALVHAGQFLKFMPAGRTFEFVHRHRRFLRNHHTVLFYYNPSQNINQVFDG